MYARLLATFCLLTSSMSIATAESPTGNITAVSLRLRSGTVPVPALTELQKELAELMNSAGVVAQWEDPNSYRDVSGYTVVVDLQGDCSVPFHADILPLADGTPIGSTAVADNHLLPFVVVNCNVLTALMSPYIADQPEAFREFVFGRAMGRVLAHELYHIVTQSGSHLDSGVAKASFSASDLMKNRFEFDEVAVNRIHDSQSVESGSAYETEAGAGFRDVAAEGK